MGGFVVVDLFLVVVFVCCCFFVVVVFLGFVFVLHSMKTHCYLTTLSADTRMVLVNTLVCRWLDKS